MTRITSACCTPNVRVSNKLEKVDRGNRTCSYLVIVELSLELLRIRHVLLLLWISGINVT